MKPLPDCRLYTFIDTAYLNGRKAGELAKQLCDGGSDLIQLRAKTESPEQVRKLAEEILPVLREAGVGLVVNDRWDIACEVGADFCHLGQEDFFAIGYSKVSELSSRLSSVGPGVGLSTHAPAQALRAVAAEPGYIAIGPVYPTPTKPGVPAVTLDYVRWAAVNIAVPWFAIGGITLQNVGEVRRAGATRICVVSAILNAPDPAGTCRQFRKVLDSAV